jgi:hypothetical protein
MSSDTSDQDNDNKNVNEANDLKGSNWGGFVTSLLSNFIFCILLGVFGSGFIYLTSRGSDLDIIFPTDELFYTASSYEVQRDGPYTGVNCDETSSGSFAALEDNFPYNMILTRGTSKEELGHLSFVERISNWFGKTVAGCFKTNRALIKGWLDNFRPNTPLGNHVFQIYIAFPFTLLITFVALITGFFTAFGAALTSDLKVSIVGMILLFFWALTIGLACVIFIRLVGTLCFFPIIENWKDVSNILACNAKSIAILFGFFVCGSAYANLDQTVAGIMGIIYMILVGHTLWKFFSSQIKK